jgi:hypothetical protein
MPPQVTREKYFLLIINDLRKSASTFFTLRRPFLPIWSDICVVSLCRSTTFRQTYFAIQLPLYMESRILIAPQLVAQADVLPPLRHR